MSTYNKLLTETDIVLDDNHMNNLIEDAVKEMEKEDRRLDEFLKE